MNMANQKVMVILLCPECKQEKQIQVNRRLLFEKDDRKNGRLNIFNYFFEGPITNPKYVNCGKCNCTYVIKKVENVNGISSLKFCKSCGKTIEPKIASNDDLCEVCD